ncbi:MAG: sulfite exporter TauE/SafE family protein [Pseudomonadota bacterium]
MLYLVVSASVFATAVVSGILGMAGGMILMAVLILSMSVANAMMLHGAVQATSNGSRAWFLRGHIRWHILPPYLLGAFAAVGLFMGLLLVPHPGVVLILVGGFAWLARLSKHLRGLDITRPITAVVCGAVVTSAQLLAGASGPTLDVFYLNSPLSRQEIVASKALTQAFGHVLKIGYYGWAVAVTVELPLALFLGAMALAVAGARVGTWILERWNDQAFQRVSQYIILGIATYCIAQGLWLLFFSA